MQDPRQFIPLVDKKEGTTVFTGGIVDNSAPNVIRYKNSPYARNFRINAGGISIRPGYAQLVALSGTGSRAFGITPYIGTSSGMLVGYKSDSTHYLSTLTSAGVQTPVSTAGLITSENRMNFVNGNNAVYCMNGVDAYGKYDISAGTYTNPVTGLGTFKPSFGVYFNNCVWASGDSANPNKIYKSASNNPDSFTGAGSDVFTAGYPITALGVNQQSLYVFTRQGIDVFNTPSAVGSTLVYSSRPLEATEGCTNHRLVVSVGKGLFYISPSNKIRKVSPNSFGMYDFVELSHRVGNGITKTMETLDDDQSQGFGYAIPGSQIICWHLKTRGASRNDIVIIYHYEFDEWMVDVNKSFYDGCLYNSNPYTISSINTSVFREEYGMTDNGGPIQFIYRTKHIDLGNPTVLKCLWQIRTFLSINAIGSVYQRVYADGNLIDEFLIDSSTIPISITGIGTQATGTYGVGTEGGGADPQYNTEIVRDKGYVRTKCKYFYVEYVSYDSGTQILLQNLVPLIETLPYLTTSHH